MKRVMVQYTVKADKADENREYVRKVFAELKTRVLRLGEPKE